MSELFPDLRPAVRQLRKGPGFTAVAGITLALGIGAKIAMFTMVYGVPLRALSLKNLSLSFRATSGPKFSGPTARRFETSQHARAQAAQQGFGAQTIAVSFVFSTRRSRLGGFTKPAAVQ
jgi:hypothetical protein